MDEGLSDLLYRGRLAARAGDADEARFFLGWVLDRCEGPAAERLEALYWMSRISAEPAEKRRYLEDVLAAEPFNARARHDLAVLDGKIAPEDQVDPDNLPAQAPGGVYQLGSEEAKRFTCPKCGGKLTYSPDGKSLACEYCQRRQVLEGTASGRTDRDEDFIVSMATSRGHAVPVDTQSVLCEGCGGEFILPPADLSACCPFCGSGHVISQEARQLIPPANLIPFAISGQEALRGLQAWFTRNRARPEDTVHAPQGVYLPAWAFSVGGTAAWRGWREQNDQRVAASGDEAVLETNLLVPASKLLEKELARLLPTYDLQGCVPYDPRYLVDWPAGTYQVSMGDASLTARQLALVSIRRELKDIRQPDVRDLQVLTSGMLVQSYQLWLLPAWIASYREDGEACQVLINGQNGRLADGEEGRGLVGWLGGLFS